MPSSKGSSQPRDRTWVSCIASGFFTLWAIREAHEHPSCFLNRDANNSNKNNFQNFSSRQKSRRSPSHSKRHPWDTCWQWSTRSPNWWSPCAFPLASWLPRAEVSLEADSHQWHQVCPRRGSPLTSSPISQGPAGLSSKRWLVTLKFHCVFMSLSLFFVLVASCILQDLSSLTRDRTGALSRENAES